MSTTILYSLMALTLISSSFLRAPQTQAQSTDQMTAVPVTLSMTWTRGNEHYGPNFVALAAPCRVNLGASCECTLNFKSTNSDEFADYIAAFGGNPVPVTFQVLYGIEPEARNARLETVGNWPAEKFKTNDRLLAISWKFTGDKHGTRPRLKIRQPADCFPLRTE